MKYKIMFMALLAMCACAFLVSQADESNAETITGSCGTNLTYSYDTDTTVLTISGEGTYLMHPFQGYQAFWGAITRDISEVVWDTPNITTIQAGCFSYTAITEVTNLPETINSIGVSCWRGCTQLQKVDIQNAIVDPSGLFRDCTQLTDVNIPNFTGTWTTLFMGCTSLQSIIVPEGVTRLLGDSEERDGCFANCKNLSEVTFPSTLTTLGYRTFFNCTALRSLDTSNITAWGKQSMAYAVLPELIISDKVWIIESEAFQQGSFDNVVYNAKRIRTQYTTSNNPFNESSVRSLTIGESVEKLPNNMFNSDRVRVIGTMYWNAPNCTDFTSSNGIFHLRNVDTIIFGDNVKHVPAYLTNEFSDTLESVSFNDGLESIGDSAFANCTSMVVLSLPDSLKSIGVWGFSNCPNLLIRTLPVGMESISTNAFSNCTGITQMYIPVGFDANISDGAFAGCTNLAKILNLSELDIQLGSEDNGHIAYYADEVRDNIGSTAIVQQKQNVVHEVIEKSDAASKLLRVLPALMAIAVISFLCGLFYYRETERNKI